VHLARGYERAVALGAAEAEVGAAGLAIFSVGKRRTVSIVTYRVVALPDIVANGRGDKFGPLQFEGFP
jgi:hypothetical protein